jgi:putative ABC transport system permease protein
MPLTRLASLWRNLIHRGRVERDLDEELRAMLTLLEEEKRRAGLSADEARRAAALELGSLESVKDHVRDARMGTGAETIAQDVRYGLRVLRRAPAFTAVAVATLALGIGANTAIFSLVDSLLLRRLPVKDPDRLAMLMSANQRVWTFPIWEQIQQRTDIVDGAFAWSTLGARFNLAQGGESQFVRGMFTTAGLFPTLGVTAALGRTLTPADDRRGGGPDGAVVVISHAFWQRHFGGAPDVVGRTLVLERVPLTIVGVTPAGFLGPDVGRSYDVAVPFGVEPLMRGTAESWLDRRSTWWLSIMVRLKPEQTLDEATLVLRGVQGSVRAATLPTDWTAQELEQEYLVQPYTLVEAATGRSDLRRQYQRPLLVVMVVVLLVLLIACANIANLLLARATARGHEWNVRLALGASRWRLARQLLIESVILSALGAGTGLVAALWGGRLLVSQLAAQNVTLDLSLEWRVLAFTTALAIVTALIFGVAPALRAARGTPIAALRAQDHRSSERGRLSFAGSLVVAQVVLSVVLVVGAGLFLRTFTSLTNQPLGLDTDPVLLVNINSQRAAIPPEGRFVAYDQVRRRVQTVPGVATAAVSVVAPITGLMWSHRVEVSGSTMPEGDVGPEGTGYGGAAIPENARQAVFNAVTPGWFDTFGTTLLAGRDVTEQDGATANRVALVNQAFARRFLKGASPIGHTVRTRGFDAPPAREIVGVVTDAAYRDVREPVPPTVYVPFAQFDGSAAGATPPEVTLSVRAASGSPGLLTKSVAAAIADIHPDFALTFRPLATQVHDTLVQERLLAMLSGFFGALALLLAGVGLYGVTSYGVSMRRVEIGIRMALGATRSGVVRLILRRVLLLVTGGIALGLVVSVWASQFVATLLFGLEPRDPVTFVTAAAVLATIGAIAGWLPAYRASRIEPRNVLSDI